MTHTAENDADGYPTHFPMQRMECPDVRCRVEVYVGTPVHPLTRCPLCMGRGRVIPSGVSAP